MNKKNEFFNSLISRIIILAAFIFIFSCNPNTDEDPNQPLPVLELRDQSYGSDPRQAMDVFLPEGRNLETTPLLIYIHGGAWIDGGKEEFDQVRAAMGQNFQDYAFIAINYRLFDFISRINQFPTQENDVIAAIQFIESQKGDWDIDGPTILAGASAGGHLALLHSYKNPQIGNIKAVVAFFPPTDLSQLYGFNQLTTLGLTEILQGTPITNPEKYAQSSPVTFVTSNSIPTVFFHGTTDTVVPIRQSEILRQILIEKNVPHLYEAISGQGHGFTPDTNSKLLTQAASFINKIP